MFGILRYFWTEYELVVARLNCQGGLDTSCILRWLLEEGYQVVCFLANVGQEEDWSAVEQKALKIGATRMVIEDLRKEFVEELCFRAIQCNAIYEGEYLLGKSEHHLKGLQSSDLDHLSHD